MAQKRIERRPRVAPVADLAAMRWSKACTISACLLGGLAMAAVLASARPRQLIDAKLLRVQAFDEAPTDEQGEPVGNPCIILRLTRLHPNSVVFSRKQTVQFRVAGKWLEPEKFDAFGMDYSPQHGQLIMIRNHRGAEAFRLHLTYSRESARNRALTALMALGFYSKAPTVSKWLTACLPSRPNWRQTVIECELPKPRRRSVPEQQGPHNPAASAAGRAGSLFAVQGHRRRAARQRCSAMTTA